MRQAERRKLFDIAFAQMPAWETWTTEQQVDTGFKNLDGTRDIRTVTTQHHVKTIPRRVRRSMARDLAKRRWQQR